MKSVFITEQAHLAAKIEAAKQGITLGEYVTSLIENSLNIDKKKTK